MISARKRQPGTSAATPRDVPWLIVWGALLGGLTELALRLLLFRGLGMLRSPSYVDPQAVWMAPLANLPLFAVVLCLVALAAGRRHTKRFGVVVAAAVGLAILEVAFISQRLHDLALVALSAGLGAQAGLLAQRFPVAARWMIRRSTIAMAGLAIIGGVALHVGRGVVERQQLAGLPTAPAEAPNVLLLVLDTVRSMELSLYGFSLPTTPALERLATEGIRFDRALATTSWTLPSHAGMFTGRYAHELSTGWRAPLDRTSPTLAEVLSQRGYATGGFVANLVYATSLFGLDRGFVRYQEHAVSVSGALAASTLWQRLTRHFNRAFGRNIELGRKTAARVNREFLEWQSSLGERPFFAFLNYFDAHGIYAPPAPYDTMFIGRSPRVREPLKVDGWTSEDTRDLRLAYDGAIRYVDSQIARLLAELEQRGVLENTLIVITSDHGEAFDEHGHLGHGSSLYLTQTQVPLLFVLPGRSVRGTVVATPVTLRDLPATVLDVLGAPHGGIPGTSLAAHWTAAETARTSPVLTSVGQTDKALPESYPSATGDLSAILDGDWHYVTRASGREALYHVVTDSLEQRDLSADPRWQAVLARLRQAHDTLRGDGRTP